jgi:hypothetical protein
VKAIKKLKLFTPVGGVRPPSTLDLSTTLTAVASGGPFYLKVTGLGVTPVGGACQPQASTPVKTYWHGEYLPGTVDNSVGWAMVGTPLPLDPGSYSVVASINLVNQSAFATQVACGIDDGAQTAAFGYTLARTTLPPAASPLGGGSITVIGAGTLSSAGSVAIWCTDDTGGVSLAENTMIVATKVGEATQY